MLHSELNSSNRTKSAYGDPINRHRLLGWASETLSKLKSDKHFLRTTANKKKHEDEIANADCRKTQSKKGKHVEEKLSKLGTNDVATYVSEIVTSKTERKIQRMAFDSIITRDNQKKKASNKDNSANTESKGNGDNDKLKAKKSHTMVSCIKDQEGGLYQHEEPTEWKKKKKKRKYKESSHEDCSADTTSLKVPLKLWVPVENERSRKKQKLTELSVSDRADCYHCCKCAAKEGETQKKEVHINDKTNMFDYMKYLSGSGKKKKYKTGSDVYTGRNTKSSSFWEGAENTGHYKQGKKKRSKHTFESMLDESEQLGNADVTKESSKRKKKEERLYAHSFSERSTSEKKKLKKYKLCTQECRCDESRSASKHVCRMGIGARCDSPSGTEESKAFEVHCGESKKRKHRHDCCFNDKLEETKNETRCSSKTEYASERSKQKPNQEDSYCYTGEECTRKKKGKKHDICSECEIISEASDLEPGKKKKKDKQNDIRSESKIISEARDHSDLEPGKKKKEDKQCDICSESEIISEARDHSDLDPGKKKKKKKDKQNDICSESEIISEARDHSDVEPGKKKKKKKDKQSDICSESEIISEARDHSDLEPGKKKKKKKDKQNFKDNENTSNSEERDKQKLYSNRNSGNTVETSFMEETQKKKQKKSKCKVHDVSVDAEEGNEEYRHKKDASVGENQVTNESMDHALLDYTSTSTTYSVKRKDKTGEKRKSETGGVESVNSKKHKAIPKETHGNTAAATCEVGYTEPNLATELTQTVNSLKDNNNDREVLTSIGITTHKNALHSRNIKRGKTIGRFGLSPISRLLETEFSDSEHSCHTYLGCKLHPKIRSRKSSESAAINISDIVIKTEPGLVIKQEKKTVDSIDPHIMDKQILDVGQDSQIKPNTNDVNGTVGGVKTTENSDAFIDKLGMQEHIATESSNDPNECLTTNLHIDGTDNDLGSFGCVEGFNDEDVGSGNEEIDINTEYCNIYDDKITVKDEIVRLTNTSDDQNNSQEHAEDTLWENFEFVGNQDTDYMGVKIESPSVTMSENSATDVAGIARVEENGSDLNTVLQYEPVPLNELQRKCNLKGIPEAADVHNITQIARETASSCWPSANGNQHQSSQFFDITTQTTGQVCFAHVPRWWRRRRIAQTLGVPVTAVYIHFNYYNFRVRKNYVTVRFFDNQCLQTIMSNASRVMCSGWVVTSTCSQ